MEPKRWHLHLSCFLLLLSSTFSDVGKITSSQNHFGNPIQSQFNTKNNTRVIAQKGGLAILPCVVKVNSPATVSWIRRKDFQLLTVGLSTHSSDKRFLVEHTRHMGHWSLRIKSVREEDRGFYECQLSIYPTQSIVIELKIVEAVAEISSAPELHIDETSTLRMECKLKRATENPAFVFWYHDSKMVNYDSQGGFLVTSIVQNNLQGGPIFRSSPANKSRVTMPMESSHGVLNNILGSPDNIKAANTPSSTPYMQPHQSAYLSNPSVSVLTVKQVNFRHAGNYTCAPSNARPASITVHVLRGEKTAAMQHANRSILDTENNGNGTFGLISLGGLNGTSGVTLTGGLLYFSGMFLLISAVVLDRFSLAGTHKVFLAFILVLLHS
ncbi:limbic system-associated membrane protein [Drosophila suzukii]|uniref:Limbic system-associated membrane protein n=1 Tax=Drosophila suzukii TaxID=28584 RepID=A0AB39ZXT5_DROSZ